MSELRDRSSEVVAAHAAGAGAVAPLTVSGEVVAGVLLVEDQDITFTPGNGAAASNTISGVDYHKGYDFDANIGYDFGGFRLVRHH